MNSRNRASISSRDREGVTSSFRLRKKPASSPQPRRCSRGAAAAHAAELLPKSIGKRPYPYRRSAQKPLPHIRRIEAYHIDAPRLTYCAAPERAARITVSAAGFDIASTPTAKST
jgi:hypothetical protein